MKNGYRYIPLEIESIFDFKDLLKNKELYVNPLTDQYRLVKHEFDLMMAVLDGRQLYRKEKIHWKDELKLFMKHSTLSIGYFDITFEGESFSLNEEQFLEMCRVTLRANGELE